MKELLACFALVAFPTLTQSVMVTADEVRAILLSAKPEHLKPTCQPAFQKCAQHLMKIEPIFDSLQQNWTNLTSIECVSRALSNGFPSNSWDCWKNGEFGQAMNCMLSSDFLKYAGERENDAKTLVKCFLDNALEGDKKKQDVV